MNKSTIWGIIVVLVLVIGGVWVSKQPKNTPVSTSGEAIKIGAIISQTGIASAFGEMSKYGVEMAAKEINDNGGVNGRKVQIILEDDHTDSKTGVGLYQKLTSVDKVDAIIGSNFDFVTQPIFGIAEMGDTVVVSPSSPRIAGSFDTNKHGFVMMSDFSKIISELRPYLSNKNYKKLGIVRFTSPFGEEITKTLKQINQELNKPEIVEETYNEIGNNDFRTVILKLKTAGVDLVFLDMAGPDPLTFVRQAKQLSYQPTIITDTAVKDSVVASGEEKNLFENVIVLNWDVTTSDFANKFEAVYGKKPGNSVNRAYDAVYILAQAITESAKKAEIPEILESKEFVTPNGAFRFNQDHAAMNTPTEIQIIKNGEFVKL